MTRLNSRGTNEGNASASYATVHQANESIAALRMISTPRVWS